MAGKYTSQTVIHPDTEGVHPILNLITVHPPKCKSDTSMILEPR